MDPELAIKTLRDEFKNECQCSLCRGMCQNRPCWGTPFEIEKIIDAGFGPRLYLDWWAGGFDSNKDLYMPQPAMVGREGDYAPDSWYPQGQCTFLTSEGLCEIHSLKPVEGVVARHDNIQEVGKAELHKLTAQCWDSEKGREVLARWKELCDGEK